MKNVNLTITLRDDAIELRIGERWQLTHYSRQPRADVFFVEVGKNIDRCCFVQGTVEWLRMDGRKPIIKVKATTIQS